MIRTVRQSFAAGELAPELHMRSDLSAYQKGAALLRNMIVRRTGSVMKRPGTDALDAGAGFGAGKTVRLFPFYYDNGLSLALLVTNETVRVFEVSPDFEHDRDFDWSDKEWTDGNVAAMRVKQAGDTLFCSAPGKLPLRMVRTASTGAWSVLAEQIDSPPAYTLSSSFCRLTRQGWTTYNPDSTTKNKLLYYGIWAQNEAGQLTKLFDDKAISVTKIWEAGASVKVEVRQDKIPATSVGDTWILCKKYGGAYGKIGSRVIQTEDIGTSTINYIEMFEDDNIIPNEYIGRQTEIRADDDEGGYGIVDFYQQRQVLAGNTAAPWTLWFSRLADFYTWTANRPADDMDPFRATIPAVRASEIRHMAAGKRLLLFTADGIYAVHSGAEGFSGRTCQLERVNPVGAGAAIPVDTGAAVIFMADDDRTLLEMRYSFAEDAHVTVDRSVLARHLTRGCRVTATAWQGHPDGALWCLLDDGTLLSFTYLPEHEVYAWARHALPAGEPLELLDIAATGSVLLAGDGEARYEGATATVILARADSGDYVLLRMRRPGAANDGCVDLVRSVEVPEPDEEEEEDGIRTLPAPEGAVWRADSGAWAVVEGEGGVEVQGPCLAEWGWPVGAALETLRPEAPDRALQALRRRVVSCTVRTLESGAYRVSDAEGGGLSTEVSGDAAGSAAHDAKVAPFSGWDWAGRVKIESPGTDKLEVLGVVTDIETEGGGR